MIDIHNHIIYGVDDGPTTIKDSMRMILEAEKMGVSTIITTPHYHKGVYTLDKVLDHFNELKSRINDFGIELFLGYEVFLNSALPDVLSEKEKYTLNRSNYLLFELPFDIRPLDLIETIQKLHAKKIVPIIAHPERNRYFIRNLENFLDLVETGCFVQLDAASIVGAYGANVKGFTKKLIQMNLVQFVASDAHRPEHYTKWYLKAYEKVKDWIGQESCDQLFIHNQNFILNPPLIVEEKKLFPIG